MGWLARSGYMAALAGLVLVPGPADGANRGPAPHPISAGAHGAAADGGRFVAHPLSDTRVALFDPLRGGQREIDVRSQYSEEVRCATPDVDRDRVLVHCVEARGSFFVPPPLVWDPSTHRLIRVEAAMRYPFGSYPTPRDVGWYALGTHWVKGSVHFHSTASGDGYANWRTGALRSYNYDSEEERFNGDLDDPGLRELPPRPPRFRFVTSGRRLFLKRRGRPTLLLGPCADPCARFDYMRGVATWVDDETARAYVVRSRRRLYWRIRDPRELPLSRILHTREALLFELGHEYPPEWSFYAVARTDLLAP